MDFFEHQTWAKRRTYGLFAAFPPALILVALMFHALIMSVAWLADSYHGSAEGSYAFYLFATGESKTVFFATCVCVTVVVLTGSAYRTYQLRNRGGDYVAELLNGREISAFTRRFEERQLMNIVEEMSIASGVMVPGVYILEREFRVNAFSAGFDKDSSVIGVTAGALEYLNREELQTLVAHEFSHILYGETRLHSMMIGILFGLDMITQLGIVVGTGCAKVEKPDGDAEYVYVGHAFGGHPLAAVVAPVLGTMIALIGSVGTLMGALIKAAVSRQREYLADAAAVQFTRNPNALKNVFLKIGSHGVDSRIYGGHALEMSHIFFAGAFGSRFARWNVLASHPSLERRIRKLDPEFDGTFPEHTRKIKLYGKDALDAIPAPSPGMIDEILNATNPRYGRFIARRRAAITDGIVDPKKALDARGTEGNPEIPEEFTSASQVSSGGADFPPLIETVPTPDAVRKSQNHSARSLVTGKSIDEILDDDVPEENENRFETHAAPPTLPEPVSLLLQSPQGSCRVFLALLLDLEGNHREELFGRLAGESAGKSAAETDVPAIRELIGVLESVRKPAPENRTLPSEYIAMRNEILEKGIERLRRLPLKRYKDFRRTVARIQPFHRHVDLFRYTFYALLRYDLDVRFGIAEARRIPVKYHGLSAIEEAVRLSLSYLAYAGHGRIEDVREAFQSACEVFPLSISLLPVSQCTFRDLDASLKKIRFSSKALKEKCLTAFRACIWADGRITPRETELYRAATAMIAAHD